MFKDIHFFFHQSVEETQDILQDEGYYQMTKQFNLVSPEKLTYLLSGKFYYLLQHPLSAEKQNNLMYMQSFSYMDTDATYYTKRKNYSSFLLLYTYDGSGELLYRGQRYTLKKGDGFLINCEEEHYYATIGQRWLHSDLHFHGGQSPFFYKENFSQKSPIFHYATQEIFQNQLEKMLRIHNSSSIDRDFRFSFELERLLFSVLKCHAEIEAPQKIPDSIRHLQRYIEDHFVQDISLDHMAEVAGVSKYHLCRQFKKHIGLSPKEYVLYLRVIQAKFLLQSTAIPSYKIGNIVGFQNEANFIQYFKREVGMTPGAFRKTSGESSDYPILWM